MNIYYHGKMSWQNVSLLILTSLDTFHNCSYIQESEGMSVRTLLTEVLLLDVIPLHDGEHVGSVGDCQHLDHLRQVDGTIRILPLHRDVATFHRGVASNYVFCSFRSRRVCLCAQIIPIYSEIIKMTSSKKKIRYLHLLPVCLGQRRRLVANPDGGISKTAPAAAMSVL